MPVGAIDGISSSIESVLSDSRSSKETKAATWASGFQTALASALSQANIVLNIVGTLCNTVPSPTPYAAPEPPFVGLYDTAAFYSSIESGMLDLWSKDPSTGTALSYATDEANLYADAIFTLLSTGVFTMTAHTGTVSITCSPKTEMRTAMIPLLTAVYLAVDSSPSAYAVKANAIAAAMNTTFQTWFPKAVFSGTAELVNTTGMPLGQLSPGAITGRMRE